MVASALLTAALSCSPTFHSQKIEATDCAKSETEQIVTVTLHRAAGDLAIKAEFARLGPTAMPSRFWTEGRDPRLTVAEQTELADFANTQDLTPKTIALLGFLADFFRAGEVLERFDAGESAGRIRPASWRENSYKLICEYIGQPHEGFFTLRGSPRRSGTAIIGRQEDRCPGRCGLGCKQRVAQTRHHQYTEECLSHDLCLRAIVFGVTDEVCMDEFWRAAKGYFEAPDCPEPK